MNNLNFGVPNLREKKEEKYTDVGVLTFHPTGEGLGRKMELNTKALELLKADDTNNQVSFSFAGQDIYIVNTSGVDNASGLKIGKTTNGFSDKKHYNFIKGSMFKLSDSETLELFFEETENEFNGNMVFKLVKEVSQKEENNDILNLGQIQESINSTEDPNDLLSDHYEDMASEYTQEQLDELNSQEYANKIDVEAYALMSDEQQDRIGNSSYNNYSNNGGTEV